MLVCGHWSGARVGYWWPWWGIYGYGFWCQSLLWYLMFWLFVCFFFFFLWLVYFLNLLLFWCYDRYVCFFIFCNVTLTMKCLGFFIPLKSILILILILRWFWTVWIMYCHCNYAVMLIMKWGSLMTDSSLCGMDYVNLRSSHVLVWREFWYHPAHWRLQANTRVPTKPSREICWEERKGTEMSTRLSLPWLYIWEVLSEASEQAFCYPPGNLS